MRSSNDTDREIGESSLILQLCQVVLALRGPDLRHLVAHRSPGPALHSLVVGVVDPAVAGVADRLVRRSAGHVASRSEPVQDAEPVLTKLSVG